MGGVVVSGSIVVVGNSVGTTESMWPPSFGSVILDTDVGVLETAVDVWLLVVDGTVVLVTLVVVLGIVVLAMDVAVLETHFLQSFAAVAVVPPLESVFK